MTDQYAISVIVPCYNSESFIKKCIASLINQNFTKSFDLLMMQ